MLTVLVACIVVNSWRSHSLVPQSLAPIRIRLTTALHNSADESDQAAAGDSAVPGADDAHAKSIRIRAKHGVNSSSGQPRLKLTIKKAKKIIRGSWSHIQRNQSALVIQQHQQTQSRPSEVSGSERAQPRGYSLGTTPAIEGLENMKQGSSAGQAASGAVRLTQEKGELGVGVEKEQKLSLTAGESANETGEQWSITEGGQRSKGAQSAVVAAPQPPEGVSCEAWLKEADTLTGGRDFEAFPITVMDRARTDNAGCDVPCKFRPAGTEPGIKFDAGFGRDKSVHGGAMVLINMESTSNYPMLDVDTAHADGWDIVMTTRLDSDVPAGYLSWAGAACHCCLQHLFNSLCISAVNLES